MSFFFNAHNDFFEEIAKYRAARKIWYQVMRDRFGAKHARTRLMRFHTQTAGVSLTAQQPMNNIARVAIQAMAAVLGGTQSLHCDAHDEALALPTADAARIALRTQQIIAYETELKSQNMLAAQPEFAVLFARIRDRISALRAFYGPGPLDIDFRAMGQRASCIRMTRCDLRDEHAERRSSRTGQVHALGGFTGEVEYQGDLAEFLPYLGAARWTGVGRQTVWGKGELHLLPSNGR